MDCSSGFCSAGSLRANLTINLTGIMESYSAFLEISNEKGIQYHKVYSVGHAVSTIPVFATPNTQVALYNQYLASSSLPSTPLIIDNVDCSLGSCSLPQNLKTNLNVDLTGLRFLDVIYVVIYESGTQTKLHKMDSRQRNYYVYFDQYANSI